MDTRESDGIGTQWDLIARLKNPDDAESWSDFLRKYRGMIHRAALRGGCTIWEAEEVVQETVIAVARGIRVFEASPRLGSFGGWLLRLTRCRVVDQLRKRVKGTHLPAFSDGSSRGLEAEIEESGSRSGSTELERSWECEWQQHCLSIAISRVRKRISPEHFDVFYRCLVLMHPPGEVAATLNTSLNQIYLIKHRVLGRVRKELSNADVGRDHWPREGEVRSVGHECHLVGPGFSKSALYADADEFLQARLLSVKPTKRT